MCNDSRRHLFDPNFNVFGYSLAIDEKAVLRDENRKLRAEIESLNSRIKSLDKANGVLLQEKRTLLDFMTEVDPDLDIQTSIINTAITMIADFKADLVKSQADVAVLQNQKKA